MVRMRVSAKSERIGLDKSQHDEEYGVETHTEIAEEVPSESEWIKSVGENWWVGRKQGKLINLLLPTNLV